MVAMDREVPGDLGDQVVVVATAMTVVAVVEVVEVGEDSSEASSTGSEEVITEEALRMFVMEASRGMAATTT